MSDSLDRLRELLPASAAESLVAQLEALRGGEYTGRVALVLHLRGGRLMSVVTHGAREERVLILTP